VGSISTSIQSSSVCVRTRHRLDSSGFTLLELLVVIVIVGITLGMVSLNALPSERQILQKDAQRIALLLQLARDEAIVRNRPIAFEAESDSYHFLLFEKNNWKTLKKDDLLRERQFKNPPVMFSVNPPLPEPATPLRIIFGREPVGIPFTLKLLAGDAQITIRADGIGHFSVE